VIPHRATFPHRVAGTILYVAIRLLAATTRFRIDAVKQEAVLAHPVCIFAIWHNRLSFCLEVYGRLVVRRQPHRRMAAVVSASRDGGFLTTILELFRVQPVRGSSSRRGAQALKELVTWGQRGYDLAITPDGPRGPRYHLQEGAVVLAQLTGLPIIPVSYRLSRKHQLKTWDGFLVPLPFGTCDVRVGEPVFIPRDATPEEREAIRQRVEALMRELGGD
jgi:lysophospholipid acyltransferase (LPLAT)-like uncharacterized protein